MTTINLTAVVPATPSGLTVIGAVGGATLTWTDVGNSTDVYEVWYNTNNTFSGASLLATVSSNHYVITGLSVTTNFWFWVRTKNIYGQYSAYTEYFLQGFDFNTLLAGIQETPTGTVTTSINWVKCEIWYTNSGTPTSVGPITFTTTLFNNSPGLDAWVNPDYARVNDSNYATVTTTYGSQTLSFTMADMGVPSGATITGIQFTLSGKTTDYTKDQLWINVGQAGAIQFSAFTANGVDQTLTAGSSTYVFDLDQIGLPLAQQLITSANTSAGTVVSSSTSAGSSTASPTVSSYGTWYIAVTATFTPDINDVVSITAYVGLSITGVTTTSGQELSVWVRNRLHDVTLGTDVPGGIKQYLVYNVFNFGSPAALGSTTPIQNIPETFIAGFRGLLIPGHSYAYYGEVMKQQVLGTPTATVSLNTSGVSTFAAGSVS